MIVSLLRSTSTTTKITPSTPTIIDDKRQHDQNPKGMQGALDSWKSGGRTTSGGGGSNSNHGRTSSGNKKLPKREQQHHIPVKPVETNRQAEEENPDEPPPPPDQEEEVNPDEEGPNADHDNKDNEEESSEHDKNEGGGDEHSNNNHNNHHADEDADETNHKAAGHDDAVAGAKPDATSTIIDPTGGISGGKRGSGPTPLGYVADYQYERENPVFRNGQYPQDFSNTESIIARQLNNKSVIKACQYVEQRKLLTRANC